MAINLSSFIQEHPLRHPQNNRNNTSKKTKQITSHGF